MKKLKNVTCMCLALLEKSQGRNASVPTSSVVLYVLKRGPDRPEDAKIHVQKQKYDPLVVIWK